MNEEKQKDILEYVKTLPQTVQDLIFDDVWENRTTEIAKKYSLNDEQTETLINTVLFVLIGVEKPDMFLPRMITDLNISRLLAEQIISDLETRVFEYAINETQAKPKNISSVPEIAPHNLPMYQPISVPKYVSVSSPPSMPLTPKPTPPNLVTSPVSPAPTVSTPTPTPRPAQTQTTPNPVSTPTPVPIPQKPPQKYVDPYREPLE